jgi:hypothetical protein
MNHTKAADFTTATSPLLGHKNEFSMLQTPHSARHSLLIQSPGSVNSVTAFARSVGLLEELECIDISLCIPKLAPTELPAEERAILLERNGICH